MYIDGASNSSGAGIGIVLINPDGVEFTYALKFAFPITNNKSEYEALLTGFRMAAKMKVKYLQVTVDSSIVANQINGDFEIKGESLMQYREQPKALVKIFKTCKIKQISRGENTKVDIASKLASLTFPHSTSQILVETLIRNPSKWRRYIPW